ncbi:type II secretion system F family protein [Abyssisolibacter fermentans]|uniref:type II secretion system F family protein n=1 Tax=Abyssisolibacter fermentans TaxID=1766203 RepID=UPI000829DDD2|nr:type II secretion system F family protein [Abyssisolibacter fermentans]
MPEYKYIAINRNGERINATCNKKDENEVLSLIRENGYKPIKIDRIVQSKNIEFSLFQKIKTRDIALFCRQFHAMLDAGLTIMDCLHILRYQTQNKKLCSVINDMCDDVQKGTTFSETINKHPDVFPELLSSMVQAGEVSGKLDLIMKRMAVHYEKENKINNKIKSAMIYPIVLSVIAVCIVIFLLVFVMPTFVGMFEDSGVELPAVTRALLGFSNIIKDYWYIIFSLLIISIIFIRRYFNSDSGKMILDSVKLRVPIVKNMLKKIITSRFTRTLATLLSSGVPLIEAIDIVSRVVGNKVVAKGLQKTKEDISKGSDLANPIKAIGVFPPMVFSMISIGEESGLLDDMLDKTADFFDDEVENTMQKAVTLLEPIMIVIMALIIGFIVLAMVMPMFDMINTIKM